MVRKLVAAAVVFTSCLGLAMADDLRAMITKVEGDKVTFVPIKGKGDKESEKTLRVAPGVKVVKGKPSKDGKEIEIGAEIEGGLKNKIFQQIDEKGIQARIVTEEGRITEIVVLGGKGGKRPNGKKE